MFCGLMAVCQYLEIWPSFFAGFVAELYRLGTKHQISKVGCGPFRVEREARSRFRCVLLTHT